ncbi:hypothetical protein HYR69_10800 [Candidatus Sumerlaeota bacterium]|nr:hypothetical protein [Candidatus Sumerlaeota bacterium]MBI3736495.1 hypothetical protein [Candidatus Sumerlaeota bacterium]
MKIFIGIVIGIALVLGAIFLFSGKTATAGPNGGDVVALDNGTTKAEVLANGDTGEVMVHTYDEDLKSPKPIPAEPITLGSGENTVQLNPHPAPGDAAGYCSRFYGQADWVRGGDIRHGWMHRNQGDLEHHEFAWNNCWKGGRNHGPMWGEMRNHSGMGMGGAMGPGGPGRMHGE